LNEQKRIGDDLSKWYICKGHFGWLICPPVTGTYRGNEGFFATGPEAHAAFARGGKA
jgi:hypothetical protein